MRVVAPYLHILRLHRPVGFLLLLFPTLTALVSAAEETTHRLPEWHLLLIFTLGSWLMRSAGCVVNDIMDRSLDGRVRRTRDRPLPSGAMHLGSALGLALGLLVLALGLLLLLNPLSWWIGAAALLLTLLYPLAKRVTRFPQLVLGVTFSMGIPMAYAAQTGWIYQEAIILFVGNFFWILAYDSIYAIADMHDDPDVGIGSSALLFGRHRLWVIAVFQGLALGLFTLFGISVFHETFFFCCIALMVLLCWYQIYLLQTSNNCPTAAIRAFNCNSLVGALLFIGTLGGLI